MLSLILIYLSLTEYKLIIKIGNLQNIYTIYTKYVSEKIKRTCRLYSQNSNSRR